MSNLTRKYTTESGKVFNVSVTDHEGRPLAVGDIKAWPELQNFLAGILQEKRQMVDKCS